MFCPIDKTKIVIMGGQSEDEYLSDAYLFNTEDESIKQMPLGEGQGFECFQSRISSTVRTGEIAALV